MIILKKIISLLLAVVLVLGITIPIVAYDNEEFNYSYSDEYNILSANIKQNTLKVKIKNVQNKDSCIVQIGEVQEKANSKNGYFNLNFDLSKLRESNYTVNIFTGDNNETQYWSFLSRDFSIEKTEGKWKIKENSFYNYNKGVSEDKTDRDYEIMPVTSIVLNHSNNIVNVKDSDEVKAAKLYNWVCTNIAYDKKSVDLGRLSYVSPDEVLTSRHAICYGIALTYRALCHAQNIPCIVQTGILYSNDGKGISHAWNEVYINGKWSIVDCTSDLDNDYFDVEKIESNLTGAIDFEYFLADLNSISKNYKYVVKDDSYDILYELDNSIKCSSWSRDELINSTYYFLLTDSVIGDLSKPITRGQFCELLLNYIFVQMQDTSIFNLSTQQINGIVNEGLGNMQIPFVKEIDSITPHIAFCYKNKIVNGKSANYFGVDDYITRQEAATMLVRTMTYLHSINPNFKYSNNMSIRFADDKSVNDWAKSNVSIVNDMGIMNGVGSNQFNPKGSYTIEQTILTLHRLYQYNYNRD